MLTKPTLIVVAVTPRNDAVRAPGPVEVDVVAAAAAIVVGPPAFLALLLHATSEVPTTTSTATCVARRERIICPPFTPRSSPGAPFLRIPTQTCRRALPPAAHPARARPILADHTQDSARDRRSLSGAASEDRTCASGDTVRSRSRAPWSP